MVTATTSSPSPLCLHRRRPRFSLGMLMLLVTLCCIGSGLWWRWPFVVERTNLGEGMGGEYIWAKAPPRFLVGQQLSSPPVPIYSERRPHLKPGEPPPIEAPPRYKYMLAAQVCDRKTETVRHGWGSELIRHGVAVSFDKEGRRIGEEHWNEGDLHGPFRRWFTEGHFRVEGNYELGEKHGSWVIHHQELAGEPEKPIYIKRIESWKRGIPDSRWKWFDKAGKSVRRIDFRDGLPTGPLGQQIEPRLAQMMREGKIPEDLLIALLEPMPLEDFVETPLKDVVEYLREASGVVILMDAQRLILVPPKSSLIDEGEIKKFEVSLGEAGKLLVPVDANEPNYKVEFETPEMSAYVAPTSVDPHFIKFGDLPITCESAKEVPLVAALATILLPHKLTCDYRFGVLWITTPDEAATWQDRTGVAEIKPPRGSNLERRWQQRNTADMVNMPVEDVFLYYREAFGVSIDTSRLRGQIRKGFAPKSITLRAGNHPAKHVIGLTLDQSGCRCRLEGETLIIEAQPHLLPPRQ